MTARPHRAPDRTPRRPPGPATRRRRIALAAGAALLVAVLAVGAVALLGRGPGGRAGAAEASAAGSATAASGPTTPWTPPPAPPTPVASGPTAEATALPSALPAVALHSPASTGDGVSASITGITAISGTGRGPGQVSGPALKVGVALTNRTAAAVPVDGAVVRLTTGTDGAPAPSLDDPSARPFSGTLAPGATARAVYVFTVPQADRGLVSVSVEYAAGAPFLTFQGSAA